VRTITSSVVAICACLSALVLWTLSRPAHEHLIVPTLVVIQLAVLAWGIAVRITALRRVRTNNTEWSLVPLLGHDEPMPALIDVYERDGDVVALGADGKTIVLGVPSLARNASLLRLLRRHLVV
jgi:hypothetical protein